MIKGMTEAEALQKCQEEYTGDWSKGCAKVLGVRRCGQPITGVRVVGWRFHPACDTHRDANG